MANANVTPHNADKLLVAIDIVSYFMKKKNPHLTTIFQDTSIGNVAEGYRKIARTAFSDYFRGALNFMNKTQADIVRKDFQEFLKKGLICKDSLVDYGRRYKDVCFGDGFKKSNFFMYCTRIAVMACRFYDNGIMDAPDVAVELIESAYPDDPNLNWTDLDFAAERRVDKEELSKPITQNYARREPAELISSENEESSNDSMSICEDDSSSAAKFQQLEGCFEKQSTSSVTPSAEVESLTVKISDQRVLNLEHTTAITEQAGGVSSLAPVSVTRISSVSPRKSVFPKDESLHSPSKRFSDELTKSSSSLGKRRSADNDESVGPNVAEKHATADIFSPSDSKMSKIQEVDKSE